jgi:hypothetical protein
MIPSFVAAILDGTEPEVGADEVFDAMTVSLAIERSAQLEQTITIPWAQRATGTLRLA